MLFNVVLLAKRLFAPTSPPKNPNDIEKNTALQYLPVHRSVSSQLSHRQTNVHFNVSRHVNELSTGHRLPKQTSGFVKLSASLLPLAIIFSATAHSLPGVFAEIILEVQVPKENSKFPCQNMGRNRTLFSFEKTSGCGAALGYVPTVRQLHRK